MFIIITALKKEFLNLH